MKKLLKIGINIVPILTPKTAKRLGEGDKIAEVQTVLMANYMTELTNTLSNGGVAIVAQQATRQRYIFASKEQQETGEGVLATISLFSFKTTAFKVVDPISIPIFNNFFMKLHFLLMQNSTTNDIIP